MRQKYHLQNYHLLYFFALTALCLFAGRVPFTHGISQTWGHVNSFAVPIYEIDLKLQQVWDIELGVVQDITYPEEGKSNDYTITSMFAFDESETVQDPATQAMVIAGGIGYNHTTVRFHSTRVEVEFNFLIYGIPLTELKHFAPYKYE